MILIFNNAGAAIMEAFEKTPLSDQLSLVEVNSLSALCITDHFYKKMVDQKHIGGICFTSSSTSYTPSPLAPVYTASTAFLSLFASSLSIEAKIHGIDVVSIHPGYISTNLFRNVPPRIIIKVLKFFGQTPEQVSQIAIKCLGSGIVSRDTGIFGVVARLADKFFGTNTMVWIIRLIVSLLPDMKPTPSSSSSSTK